MDSCLRRVAVCWEPKTILSVAEPYQINVIDMIQRYCSFIIDARMKIIAKYGMTCQNAGRMTMLEKGTCLQWRPLVYSDLPNYIDHLLGLVSMPGEVKDPTQGVNV